ncbi:MAG: KEOPS complex subunit Pcc1 [Candidatus Bathyarchaeia archaeon]
MIREAYATLRIKYPSEREADVVYKAIQPETKVVLRYRTRINITRSGKRIILTFEAKDTTALRASVNSYLSWIISLKNIYDFLEKEK